MGPTDWLLVVRCTHHDAYFTLYPPGWTPWGRRPVVADSPDQTVFGAAVEAAGGTLWPRHQSYDQRDGRVAAAQSRHIQQAARWLGLGGADGLEDAVFEVLEMPLLQTHRQARVEWAAASTRRRRGEIIADVLEAVPAGPGLAERLLRAGSATQVYDIVYTVDAQGVLRRLPPPGST